ncbi:radical SAM family heme chaperone HemW [Ascidiimonas sp. W6]|uniref:radical SAM family heme chaperone HemW n=1 Tax=Ascidiimonas meishanensis TaxID=3128903 RepID=UPI0030ED986D
MSGIYLHIPFCKQACYYCDFHFSTSLKKKDEVLQAIHTELSLRKNELQNDQVETIYFGGGTPSLLSVHELNEIVEAIHKNYNVVSNPEITIEANPDDLFEGKIKEIAESEVNRLSIGIQSFFEEDLKLMNRAHNAKEAAHCLELTTKYFTNISIDLIYGIPQMTEERWLQNIQKALSFSVPHISAYALTVEPNTALQKFISKGLIAPVDDEVANKHFNLLVALLEAQNFKHYELSNFGKEGFFSKNNTAYWQQKKYLGIGPSAHSYDGIGRSWNVANNSIYVNKMIQGILPSEREELSLTDQYNEYIMTGLRTQWGVSLKRVNEKFGDIYTEYLLKQAEKYLLDNYLYLDEDILRTSRKGKFLSDGIASDLFLLNLESK